MPVRPIHSSSCYDLAVQTGYDFKFRASSSSPSSSEEDSKSWTSDDSHSTTASSPPSTGFECEAEQPRHSGCPSLFKGARSLQTRLWNERQAYHRRSQHGNCDHQASTHEGCPTHLTQSQRPLASSTSYSNSTASCNRSQNAYTRPATNVGRNVTLPTPESTTSYSQTKVEQLTILPTPAQPIRQNPRRTQSSTQSSVCQTQSRCPPQLTRQSNRQQNFVENLVDTAAQMIETIWPLSASEAEKDESCGKNLIDLRTFIQEVLKRSKTSFYTLQVALYYLILIKPHLPAAETNQSSHAEKAMHCGRRMFLAALILASKYLQDRNYSARAWSKISGLKITEINTNEIAFLTAVGWKLHIPEKHFQRWSNIIFKYSISTSLPTSISVLSQTKFTWKGIVQRLTPELDESRFFENLSLPMSQLVPVSVAGMRGNSLDTIKSPTSTTAITPAWATSATMDSSPNFDTYSLPTFATPAHPFRTLPTPVDTPMINGSCTPAARTWSRGETMRGVMQQAQRDEFKSCSLDGGPVRRPACASAIGSQARGRIIPVASLVSSPASMVSDTTLDSVSSGVSRSSSVSSTRSYPCTNSTCPPGCTAHQNNISSSLDMSYHQSTPAPVVVSGDDQSYETEMDAILVLASLSRSEMIKTNAPVNRIIPRPRLGQKRERPLSVTDQDICEETRRQLAQAYDRYENAVAPSSFEAKSFVLSRPDIVNQMLIPRSNPSGRPDTKRSRTALSNEIQSDSRWPHGSDRTVSIR